MKKKKYDTKTFLKSLIKIKYLNSTITNHIKKKIKKNI